MSKYDLVVAYRICPFVSKALPPVYWDDKYKLSKLCCNSFKLSLGNLNVKLYAILDGCPPEYEKIFTSNFKTKDLELLRFDGIGNLPTFKKQIEILSGQSDAETVYFAEDDYFYLPKSLDIMLSFFRGNPDAHFVTPYDHLDYYTHPLHLTPSLVKTYGGKHWRTVNSTCLTFLTNKEILHETKDTFLSYCNGNFDASVWLALTKNNLSPASVIKMFSKNKQAFKIILQTWRHSWSDLLTKKKKNLWVAIPSLATHMVAKYIAPTIDWNSLFYKAAGKEVNIYLKKAASNK